MKELGEQGHMCRAIRACALQVPRAPALRNWFSSMRPDTGGPAPAAARCARPCAPVPFTSAGSSGPGPLDPRRRPPCAGPRGRVTGGEEGEVASEKQKEEGSIPLFDGLSFGQGYFGQVT